MKIIVAHWLSKSHPIKPISGPYQALSRKEVHVRYLRFCRYTRVTTRSPGYKVTTRGQTHPLLLHIDSRVTLKSGIISSPVVPNPSPIRPSHTRIFMFVTYLVELSVIVWLRKRNQVWSDFSETGSSLVRSLVSQWVWKKNKRMKSWYTPGIPHGTTRVPHLQL